MSARATRTQLLVLLVLIALAALTAANMGSLLPTAEETPAKAKRKTVGPLASVIAAPIPSGVKAPPTPPSGFSTQTRLGFFDGDQWEPAIAADRFGNVYML